MSGVAARLAVGTSLFHDDASWKVVELTGRAVLLRRWGGHEVRQVEVGWLLGHPSTRFSDLDPLELPEPPAVMLSGLSAAQQEWLHSRVEHVQEVLTGFRHGDASAALPGEPRAAYGAAVSRMDRYRAKAAELGAGVSTIRRWTAAFERSGPAGLLTAAPRAGSGPLGKADARWVEVCREVLASHVEGSRPTRALVLAQVQARLEERYGPGAVPVPASTRAYELLAVLSRGTNAFTGSTKAKRSIAKRPAGAYGRLRACRPGEYVMLDTNRLDVYAMDQLTCRWVQPELTVAMDVYSRCILGLRLTPVSTKAADVAAVLYETLCPPEDSRSGLPVAGIPGTLMFDAAGLRSGGRLPSAAPETVVYDNGQVFLSEHMRSVCATFGISLQPARPYTPTDKAPLERWFRSLNEGLLVALPGYKGADVHSRGREAELQAFFFLSELEAIIREWITSCYHQLPHQGLHVPEVPGLEVSPLEMFEHGVCRAGYLTVLDRADLAYDFLQVAWTSVQHYGVQINSLRYQAPVLVKYRNQRSAYLGKHAGKWPFSYDPGDVTRVFFRDPDDGVWHTVLWEHAASVGQPLSQEALAYARRLAAARYRFPDTKHAVAELLQKWGAGLAETAPERRMALRLAETRLALLGRQAPPHRLAVSGYGQPVAELLESGTHMPVNGDGGGQADEFYGDVMETL